MKIHLKRIKRFTEKPNVPDYEAFLKTEKGYFQLVGYLRPTSSDIDLTIKKITQDELNGNSFLAKSFNKWLGLR